jgi:hypothetical protein
VFQLAGQKIQNKENHAVVNQYNTVLHQSKSVSMDVGVSVYEKLG